MVSGSVSLAWSFLRTGLVSWTLRKASSSESGAGQVVAEP